MLNINKRFLFIILLVLGIVTLYIGIYFKKEIIPEKFIINNNSQCILIAHAAGRINGRAYTNSLEALQKSFEMDYKFIEIDILESCDGKLVAAHDWKHFNKITGKGDNLNICVNASDFMQRKIFNEFTPIDAVTISEMFSKEKDVYLVTDKITNFTAIKQQLKIPVDNLLVEVFSYEQYQEALKNGIKYPMLCVWNRDGLIKYMDLLLQEKVAIITMAKRDLHLCKNELESLQKKNISVFVFTENDVDKILEYAPKYVTGFYTDDVYNKDLAK